MRVGIIGSGQVGQTLAAGFSKKGHDVVLGTRDPKAALANVKAGPMGQQPLSAWAKANPKVKVATMAEAAKHGEVLVMAVHGTAMESAVKAAGPANLAGKLVLDTSNPLEFGPNGVHKPASIPDSCLQVGQRAAPKAKFVKAWNQVPGGVMVDPKLPGGPGDIFTCGDDATAKADAAAILKAFGWNTVDVGGASVAPYVEAMGLAVINYGAKSNDWGWGLKMLGRK
jgi:hypothetical protein